jgi:hypothetical protein
MEHLHLFSPRYFQGIQTERASSMIYQQCFAARLAMSAGNNTNLAKFQELHKLLFQDTG